MFSSMFYCVKCRQDGKKRKIKYIKKQETKFSLFEEDGCPNRILQNVFRLIITINKRL